MRLLTPSQVKDIRNQELTRDVLRTKEVLAAAQKAHQEFATAQADFSKLLADLRVRWATEEEEHAKRVLEMTQEIEVLENKKNQALIPIEIARQGAENEVREAELLLRSVKEKEAKNEETAEHLQDRLDEVADRESKLIVDQQKLQLEQDGIESQKKSIIEGSAELSQRISDFTQEKLAIEKELTIRKNEVFLQERSNSSKSENLEKKETELSEWSSRLHEERKNLDIAWKELERKKYPPQGI